MPSRKSRHNGQNVHCAMQLRQEHKRKYSIGKQIFATMNGHDDFFYKVRAKNSNPERL